MVVGRREFSVIVLAVTALLFYLVLLSTVPSSAQTGDGTTDVDQNITIDDIEEITVDEITEQEDKDLQEDIIAREPTVINIPRKPLPPTGGLPVYATVAGFILAGTGLLTLGVGIRRGQRR